MGNSITCFTITDSDNEDTYIKYSAEVRQAEIDAMANLIVSKGHTCVMELLSYPSQLSWCKQHDICKKSKIGEPFAKNTFCDFCKKAPCTQFELKDELLKHPCAQIVKNKVITCGKTLCITEEIKTINETHKCAKISISNDESKMIIKTCKQKKCLSFALENLIKDMHGCGFIDYEKGKLWWCKKKVCGYAMVAKKYIEAKNLKNEPIMETTEIQ